MVRAKSYKSFSYSAAERAALAAIVEQAARRDVGDWLAEIQSTARAHLWEYDGSQFPLTTRAARKAHYRAVSKAAATLLALLEDRSQLEGGSAAYLVADCGPDDEAFSGRFSAAVETLAQRAAVWAETGHLPGYDPRMPRWAFEGNTNIRTRLAEAMLKSFEELTGTAASVYRRGPAVAWLLSSVNPPLRFARKVLEAEDAVTVPLTEDSAVDTIRKVKAEPVLT